MRSATPPALAGIGLKAPHLGGLLAGPVSAVDFLEVHAENYLVAGGPFLRHLDAVRARWPLSVHGVGLSIGGPGPLDAVHLQRLKALLSRCEPAWFSEHLAWSRHDGQYLADLLPVAHDRATLQRVCDHVDEVQATLGRRLLLENPSRYVELEVDLAAGTLDEAGFLAEVVARTGCGLLVDVNNAHVSAANTGTDAWALLGALPAAAIGEIHLAGHQAGTDSRGAPLLLDTHDAPVADPVWALYRRLLQRLGRPVPTLIERDAQLPPLPELLAEAARARADLQAIPRAAHAAAGVLA